MAKGQQRDCKREEFWRGAMERFGSSGLSVREFCARERLGEPSFYFWRRAIRERDERRPQPAFVPVVVSNGPSGKPEQDGIVIEVRDAHRPLVLRLPAALPIAQVAELVHAIAADHGDGGAGEEAQP